MSEGSATYTVQANKPICGIDPDTKAITLAILTRRPEGVGPGPEPFVVRRRFETTGRRAEDRFLQLARQVRDGLRIVTSTGCSWVYLEKPMVGPNRKAAIDMGMIVGMIRGELDRLEMPHSLVDPGVWKKALLGNGHATKDEIKAWAVRHLGLEDGLAQDFYDAACLAMFGLQASHG